MERERAREGGGGGAERGMIRRDTAVDGLCRFCESCAAF